MVLFTLQALAEQHLGYEVANMIHVKSFEMEGCRPFWNADDNYYVMCMLKRL